MTPTAILEEAKARFSVLLHDEDAPLQALLTQALGTYQDKAGVTYTLLIQESDVVDGNIVQTPTDYLHRLAIKDKKGQFVPSGNVRVPIEPTADNKSAFGQALMLDLYEQNTFPLTLTYLANIRDQDASSYDIPNEHIPMLIDYVEALIAIPNAERINRVSVAGKVDTAQIPDNAALYDRKTQLEERMSAARAILPMVSIV